MKRKFINRVLSILLMLCMVVTMLPLVALAAGTPVKVTNLRVEQPESTTDYESLIIKWDEMGGVNDYTITYDNKVGGVSDPQIITDAAWSEEGYTLTGLTECRRYDITVKPNLDGGIETATMGVTRSSRPSFEFIPIDQFPGNTNISRYHSLPGASLESSGIFVDKYVLDDEIELGKNSVFRWYLQGGFNNTDSRDHVDSLRLFDITDNREIPLDYGTTNFGLGTGNWPKVSDEYDGTFEVQNKITSGDFELAVVWGNAKWIRFEAKIDQYLKPGRTYILAVGPYFHTGGRNPNRLNKVFEYQFTVKEEVKWPDDAHLSISNVGATTATLNWPSVVDENLISGYALYVNGVLEDNNIPGTQTHYDMEGLSPGKQYTFEIVAKAKQGPNPEPLSGFVVTGGKIPLTFTSNPRTTVIKETAYTIDYRFVSPVDLDNFYLAWNFNKGIDRNLEANLTGIRVYDKAAGSELYLDKGVYPYEREDATGNIIAGDFRYTKVGGGGGTGGELRLLSFEPTEDTLGQFEMEKEYILEMQPDFINNNGENTLGKITSFAFMIAPDDEAPPEWPDEAVITPSVIGPNSMVLTWPEATDNSNFIKEYRITVNGGSPIRVPGDTTSYKLTALAKDTLYNIEIIALDAKNNESEVLSLSQKTIVEDSTPPTWVDGKALTIKNVAADNLDLSWTEAVDDIEFGGYKVYQNNGFIKDLPGDVTTFHVTGLAPNTQYTFQIQAYDAAGNTTSDGPSKLITTLNMPADTEAPTWTGGDTTTSTVYSVTKATITLTWPWAIDNIVVAGYDIYCEDDYVVTVDSTKNSYTDVKAVDGNRYTYKVYAFDPSGNRSSAMVFTAVYTGDPDADITPPFWPTNSSITLSDFGTDSVVIRWSEAGDNIGVTNYLVKNGQLWIRGIFEGSEYPGYLSFDERYFFYSPETYNANNHGDTSRLDLIEGRPTTFSIKAYDRPQNSTMGDPTITFYPGTNPTAGSGIPFRLKNVANTRGTLNSITGAVNNVTNPTDPVETVLEFEFDNALAADYMNKIKLYNQETGAEIDISSMLTKETVDGKDIVKLSIIDNETLEQGKTYKVVLAADLASTGSAKLGFPIAWEFTTAINDKEAPVFDEEAELEVEFKIAPDTATLTWPAASDNVGVTEYVIYKDDTEVATVAGDVLTYDVPELDTETSYNFKIVARDYLKNESTGLTKIVTTPAPNTNPPTFSGSLTFTEISSDNLTINWPAASAPYAIKEYEVYQDNTIIATVGGTTLSYTATGLTGETAYNFSVVAKDYSNNVSEPLVGSQTTAVDTIRPVWPENAVLRAKNIKNNSVKLYWTPANDNVEVTKYTIYENGSVIGTVAGTETEYTVSGLDPNTKYIFAVQAEDAKENKTETMLELIQYTAMAKTCEGANFGFALTNVPNENVSIGAEVINTVTVNTLAQTAIFSFDFDRELENDTWLENIKLVKSTEPSVGIVIDSSAFSYTTNDGKSTLIITIPAEKLTETGEYQLILKNSLEASDGTLIGKDYLWKFNVMAASYSIIDVAGGYNSYSSRNNPSDRYYLVVKSDGTVWGWGNNDYGHLGDGTTQRAEVPTKTLGLTDIVKIYAGRDSSFALDQDGNLYGWGSNEYGQLGRGILPLGTGGRHGNNLPVKITGLPRIVDMSYGSQRVVALDENGEVWTWGFRTGKWQSPFGVLSIGTPEKVPELSNIIAVDTGWNHSLAVDEQGDVYHWHGTDDGSLKKIEGLDEIKAVSIYGNNYGTVNLALRKDGTVWTWGDATVAQVTTEEDNHKSMSVIQVEGAEGIKEIYAESLSMLTSDRRVQKINIEINDENSTATAGDILTGFDNISKMADFAHRGMIINPLMDGYVNAGVFLQMDGTMKIFEKTTSIANVPDLTPKAAPVWPEEAKITVRNNTEKGMTVSWDRCGDNIAAYALYKDGVLLANVSANTLSYDITGLTKGAEYTFKVESRFAASAYSTDGPELTVSTLDFWEPAMTGKNKVAAGTGHSLLIDAGGKVWAWGTNDYGQLGNSSTTSSNIPVSVYDLEGICQVATGDTHSVALDTNGDVWVWGDNSKYQLGNGTTENSNVPIKVTGVNNIVDISAAGDYTLAVRYDGTLWSWGSGTFGIGDIYVLVDGNGHTPVKMRHTTARVAEGTFEFTDIKMAAASRNFYAVLFADGTISRIGSYRDQVGAPTYSLMANRTNIMGVQGISAGDDFLMALLEDGTVAVLGDNNQGQYGVGNRTNPNPANPKAYAKVQGLTDVSVVSAGGAFGLALKEDGTVWGWGRNDKGQLGCGNIATQTIPVKMSVAEGVEAIDAGTNFSILMLDNADLNVFATGDNKLGQLGNATYEGTLRPVIVMFDTVEDTEAPTFPVNFAITAFKDNSTTATIMWGDAVDNIGVASYKLFDSNDEVIATLFANVNEYQVTDLIAGVTNTYYIKAYDFKGNESEKSSRVTFDISSLEERPELFDPFIAKITNVANQDKDVAVNTAFEITFAEPIILNDDITNGNAIKLLAAGTTTPISASYTLSPDGKELIVKPKVDLDYGTDYTLWVTNLVKNAKGTLVVFPTSIEFSTSAFKEIKATATASDEGINLEVKLTNSSPINKDIVVKYVVRRDKGARLESGGTVAVYGEKNVNALLAGQEHTINIFLDDISKDIYDSPLGGHAYVDIYITNTSGLIMADPVRLSIN